MKPVEMRVKSVSPGEVIISEGHVGLPALYLIKDGQVEISVLRHDERIVLSALGKGQFFGESLLVGDGPHPFTAKALSYCELQIVDAAALKAAVERLPTLLRHMLRSLIVSGVRKDEVLVEHEKLQAQPEFLGCAHVLALMAAAAAGPRGLRRGGSEESVSLPVAEVVKKCREVTGRARRHVAATLKHMALLNLVTLENHHGSVEPSLDGLLGGSLSLRFNPRDIASRAQELARHNLDGQVRREQELIELEDLAALTGVDRALLLRKLAHGEIADELFNFRRTAVLRYVAEKGKDYFAKRPKGTRIDSVADLMAVDPRTLFDALNALDEFDLAKLLQGIDEPTLRNRLLACIGRAKREEIETLLAQDAGGDPEEAQHIEELLLDTVRMLRRPAGRHHVARAAEHPASA